MRLIPIGLVVIAMILGLSNVFFLGGIKGVHLISTICLLLALVWVLMEQKRVYGYNTYRQLIKGELDAIFIMIGIVFFGMKYFVPDLYSNSLHLISLSMIIFVIGFRQMRKSNQNEETE